MKAKTIALLVADVVVGAALVTGFVATGTFGLTQGSRDLYDHSLTLQSYIDTIGFPGFALKDYPVAFYCGGSDYVIFEGEVTQREAVIGATVGTSMKVNGRQEVFVPCREEWDTTLSLLFAGTDVNTDKTMLDAMATATVWHETHHGWQQTHLDEAVLWAKVEEELGDKDQPDKVIDPNTVIDASAAYQKWFTADFQLLVNARDADSDAARKALLQKWVEHQDDYNWADLKEGHKYYADFYEVMEGSAYYIEKKVFLYEAGQEAYDSLYEETPSQYLKTNVKYYHSGAVKAEILDLISPGWQASFTMVEGGFNPYIIEAVANLP
jgi:hypothetical protein